MAFAKVSLNNINVKKFCEFSVGEFFRFYDSIYVKCGYEIVPYVSLITVVTIFVNFL